MLRAFALAVAQLGDRRILAVLARTVLLTLAIFVVLGGLLWFALARLMPAEVAGVGWLVASLMAVILGWLLFRLVAVAVLQLFGDEIVAAVEARHYPAAAAEVRPLGFRNELTVAVAGLSRSFGYNLAALPVALLLAATGIGAALVFAAVNAVLLGRELTEMVALRHRGGGQSPPPLPPLGPRLVLGGITVLLMAVPLLNLLAPVLGAAAATHLVHARLPGRRAAHA